MASTNGSVSKVTKCNHILVCDDTDTNLVFAEYLIRKVNPDGEVTCAESAAEAIEILRASGEFSLVFLDVEMPEMTGIECARVIRTFNTEVSIVALTAYDDAATLQKCLDAGMDALASKPFREASIQKVVETYNQRPSTFSRKASIISSKSGVSVAQQRGFYSDGDNRLPLDKYLKILDESLIKPKQAHRTEFLKSVGITSDSLEPIHGVPGIGLKDTAAGGSFTAFVFENGRVLVHGPSSLNLAVYPDGKLTSTSLPVPITNIAAGAGHIIAWSASTKHLFSWGENQYAALFPTPSDPLARSWITAVQLGRDPKEKTSPIPAPVTVEGNVIEASCGDAHTLVLTDVGLFGFGLNRNGQLAQTTQVVPIPSSIFVGNNIISKVACGAHHSLAITNKGLLLCWGDNQSGQCGQAPFCESISEPTVVESVQEIVQAAGGENHTLVLNSAGRILSWGSRSMGQLGRRISANATHEPGLIEGTLGKLGSSAIDCCGNCSAAVDIRGNLWSWGMLQGEGFTSHSKVPRLVDSSDDTRRIFQISTGNTHMVAMLRDANPIEPIPVPSEAAGGRRFSGALQKSPRGTGRNLLARTISNPSNPPFVPAGASASEDVSSESESGIGGKALSRNLSYSEDSSLTGLGTTSSFDGLKPILKPAPELTEEQILIIASLDSGVTAEFSSEETLSQPQVLGMYSAYADNYLGKNHFLFVANGKKNRTSKVVAVLRLPENGVYKSLVFNRFGIFRTTIDQRTAVGADVVESPRDLDVKLLTFLINNGNSAAFNQTLAGFTVDPHMVPSSDDVTWHMVSSTKSHLPLKLLSLEHRLGFPKRFTVGVICNIENEHEEAAMNNRVNNGEDDQFRQFLLLLGSYEAKAGWSHYDGGMSPVKNVTSILYTSWRGHEIVFHVAAHMSRDQCRQFVGNNKCLLIFSKQGKTGMPGAFRGNVNSMALVVQYLAPKQASCLLENHKQKPSRSVQKRGGYRIATYFRNDVPLRTTGLSHVLFTSKDSVRDTVLANLVNGHAAVSSSIKAMQRLWAEEMAEMCDEYASQDMRRKTRRGSHIGK